MYQVQTDKWSYLVRAIIIKRCSQPLNSTSREGHPHITLRKNLFLTVFVQLSTNVLLNVVFHTDFSMLLSVTLFGPLPLFIVMEVKVVMVIG